MSGQSFHLWHPLTSLFYIANESSHDSNPLSMWLNSQMILGKGMVVFIKIHVIVCLCVCKRVCVCVSALWASQYSPRIQTWVI